MTEEQRRKRKEYKAKYFQDNKEAILKKRKERPPVTKKKSREYYIRYKYKTEPEEIEAFLIVQKGLCMICEVRLDASSNNTKPHIDHDHSSGNVRGVLCHNCNVGIGHFKDDPKLLSKAIKYLGGINE